ncbi:pyroglutamyl-peptidase I [Lactobacillus kefiranofaciens]|uniref:Pyrrolidone-carboxylate peptidase n=1 Tax=Lactobacillus kefiranofaciens TaxID=267818 RepID=A0AAX3UBQ2_9LACO|nr:pyroglutamyl-peptidase I [Lactobacillus kefiranofaciens]AEG41506.1 Pyrrolidone-carboxylate peptidase [Lactobacillus kefiranofaciens subsp. kefiranofaciens]MCJ2172493.1 pyroglutamyl-peptidase I [Lactobacillus kefiranofaciens]MCP9331267.1 pyroglutamyl-peptidase I [Lactobacillus kefiranofaciens]MDF4143060.1 pyroglutamyl-peptidase I [Lactobacillus kefiranofaciens]PAK97888.1 pyroglutamyl-peptidase I [Lactobacillus kefiranofaciens]
MKILVTGFDPFGGEKVNPAIEAVKKLPDAIDGNEIIKLEVPTIFYQSAQVVKAKIEQEKPDMVINVGQAGGRSAITPERIAINFQAGSTPDNSGKGPKEGKIETDGADGYFTQLPIKQMVTAIRQVGIPAMVSNSAGTYVCNHLFYEVQYMRVHEFPDLKAGFIHIPFLPNQVKNGRRPSMSLNDMVTGLTAAIKEAIHD